MSAETFQKAETLEDAKASLSRIQEFDPSSLVQRSRLGENSFDDVVDPARKLIEMFQQLPVEALNFFPNAELTKLKKQADAIFNRFSQIEDFNVNDGDVANRKQSLIDGLWKQLQPTFTELLPFISYTAAKSVDIPALERSARSTVQSIKDETSALMEEISAQKNDADEILEDVRKTAAERGVSDEAHHFQTLADDFKTKGDDAEKSVKNWAWIVGLYAICSILFHKVPFLAPVSNFDAVQLGLSKFLVFVVLAAIFALRVKTLLSHRHNEVVNRHRQNSLMTFRSLVSAGGSVESRDIVLQQAATAIYQPQDTGYVRSSESSNTSITEFLPRASLPINPS